MSFRIDPAGGPTGAGVTNFPGPSVADELHRKGGPLAQEFRRKAARARTREWEHKQRHGIVAGLAAHKAKAEAEAFDKAAELARREYLGRTG